MNKSATIALWCVVAIVGVCAVFYCGDKLRTLAASDLLEPAVKPQVRFILGDLSANEEAMLLNGWLSSPAFLARVEDNEDIAGEGELRAALREGNRMFFSAWSVPGAPGAVIIEVSGCRNSADALLLANAGFEALCDYIEAARRNRWDQKLTLLNMQKQHVDETVNHLSAMVSRGASLTSQGDAVKWNTLIEALTLRELELTGQLRVAALEYESLIEARGNEQYGESRLLQEAFASDAELQKMTAELAALTNGPAADASDQTDRRTVLGQAIQARRAQLLTRELTRQDDLRDAATLALDLVRDDLQMAVSESRRRASAAAELEMLRRKLGFREADLRDVNAEISDAGMMAEYQSYVAVLVGPVLVR